MSNIINSKLGEITYEVIEDGYKIYLNGTLWIHQYEPYIPNHNLSYEENAIKQIEDIIAQEQASEEQAKQNDRIEQAIATILANQIMEG